MPDPRETRSIHPVLVIVIAVYFVWVASLLFRVSRDTLEPTEAYESHRK